MDLAKTFIGQSVHLVDPSTGEPIGATELAAAARVAPATNILTSQLALSTTVARVLDASIERRFAEIKNTDASINMYFGDTNAVTTSNGYLLRAGESFGFGNYTGEVWVVAASGTPTVSAVWW